jgi:hypothetical protein
VFAHDGILSARGMSVNHASAARPYRFHIYDADARRIFLRVGGDVPTT